MTQRPNFSIWRSAMAVLVAAHAVAGCGGGSDAATAPPPPANTAPVAAFASANSVAAGVPIAFDATASADADGDVLTYSWDFGEGRRGGGQKIARVFDSPGNVSVRLLVDDGRGATNAVEKLITVTAGPVAQGAASALAIVRDAAGAPLVGVTMALAKGGGTTSTTNADGQAQLTIERGVPVVLRFSKPGYADQIRSLNLPAAAESGYLELAMQSRESALTLASATAGGTLDGKDGARVTFAPNSLVDAAGNAVSGAVQVSITPVDVANHLRAFPGRFQAVRTDATQGLLLSYGTAEFLLSANGAPVQMAAGKKASIEIPIYTGLNRDGSAVTVGSTMPLWSLDERTGAWVEEGVGTVVAAPATPTGLALRGEVTHFTWWNSDQFEFPPGRSKPKCLVDTNLDGVLEDLTGTGYCWHYGTGPEQPNNNASTVFTAQSGRARALAAPPPAQRIPRYAAEAVTPVSGGVVLEIPADMDITFRSYAKNGSLMGSKVVRLGPGVEQDVPILLVPVKQNPGTLPATLPYDDMFSVATPGEVDRFSFAVEAGAQYEVTVQRATASFLDGSVRVVNGSTQLSAGDFGALPFAGTVSANAAGTYTVEVTAGGNAPGAYRVQVRKVVSASCANPTPLAFGSTVNNVSIAAGATVCYAVTLAADDIVDIVNTQGLSATGTARLFTPSNVEAVFDGFGAGNTIALRAAVVAGGTYRLEIANTGATTATLNGLVATKLTADGVLTLPQSVSGSGPGGGANERNYVIKGSAGGFVGVVFDGKGTNQPFQVSPGAINGGGSGVSGRVVPVNAAVWPIVTVVRANPSLPWNFDLSTRVADAVAVGADISLNATAPGLVQLYRLEGSTGQQFSFGTQHDIAVDVSPTVRLYRPNGTQLQPATQNKVYTLQESGAYTVEVANNLGAGAFMLRFNPVAAAEVLTPAANVERSFDLALGEIRLYTVPLVQGRLLALKVASANSLDMTAVVLGGNVFDGFASVSAGPAPSLAFSGARFVQQSATATVAVYSEGVFTGRASGPMTWALQMPTPAAAVPGQAYTATLQPQQMQSFALTLPNAGKFLQCVSYGGAAQLTANAQVVVWGPSAPIANYSGDLITGVGAASITRDESIGNLRAGSQTVSLAGSLAAGTAVTGRLVELPAPVALSIGAAATSGNIALPCERRYYSFAGVAGQSYTLRITGGFAGTLRVFKLPGNGDYSTRGPASVPGTDQSLVAGLETVAPFTIPSTVTHGNGTYIVDIDANDEETGAISVQLTSP